MTTSGASDQELAGRLLTILRAIYLQERIGVTIKRLVTELGLPERTVRALVKRMAAEKTIRVIETRPLAVAPAEPQPHFDAHDLDRMIVSLPLQELLRELRSGKTESDRFQVINGRVSLIIDLNLAYPGGLLRARHRVFDLLVRIAAASATVAKGKRGKQPPATEPSAPMLDEMAPRALRDASGQYVFARLTPDEIHQLVKLDQQMPRSSEWHGRRDPGTYRAIYRLWPDNVVSKQSGGALSTIKADAATATFGCSGRDIVWAVLDSGIDGGHPHFAAAANLENLPPGIVHMDFVASPSDPPAPLVDKYGHGTHVAGIIAGSLKADPAGPPLQVQTFERDAGGNEHEVQLATDRVSGVAPECKLVSYKVLDDKGRGGVIGVIAALEEIYRANGFGKLTRIHGVNMSLGYPFEPRWFACGHSPLCEVVDRLVRSGVVVVVAAGNNGYGMVDMGSAGMWGQGMAMSITDPGNADRAITVGSTHRDQPHTFGVSYFSSKGPTGDGRRKPDLLAPGERIVSCASTSGAQNVGPLYKEDSGTSMAAPHVSGAIAAFLSVRREFVGQSDAVKEIFLTSALDLRRDHTMQGHGLLDLLRALQSA